MLANLKYANKELTNRKDPGWFGMLGVEDAPLDRHQATTIRGSPWGQPTIHGKPWARQKAGTGAHT